MSKFYFDYSPQACPSTYRHTHTHIHTHTHTHTHRHTHKDNMCKSVLARSNPFWPFDEGMCHTYMVVQGIGAPF